MERLASQVSASLVFASFLDISGRELIEVLSASARGAVNERGGAVVDWLCVRMRGATMSSLPTATSAFCAHRDGKPQ